MNSGMVSSSCSTSDTRCVNLVRKDKIEERISNGVNRSRKMEGQTIQRSTEIEQKQTIQRSTEIEQKQTIQRSTEIEQK